jgi:glyoxylase-like metal-dependent hydrolase (beta-lactamase superfamily II)
MQFGAPGALIAATVALVAVPAAQRAPAPDPLVPANATIKVAEHTYAIPDRNIPLVPNVGIVVGTNATLVIDPGLGRRNGETALNEAMKIKNTPSVFIASTHFHPEHTTGYAAFPPSAKYVNSRVQQEEFDSQGAQMIQTFSSRSAATAELLNGAGPRKVDISFDREYRLDLGGVHVRFLVVGPTHTRGDTGLFVEEDRVLFSGDVVMKDSFLAAGAASSMKAWLAAFDTFEALHPSVIVPSHGAIGDGSLIADNRAVMAAVGKRARELKAQGKSADETAAAVQAEVQAEHPAWPRANGLGAAARAAYAEAQ